MDVLIGIIIGMVLGFILSTISTRLTIGHLRKKAKEEDAKDDDPANWWKHRSSPYQEDEDEDK